MPGRSNDFQRFVALIEGLARSREAVVTESAELTEAPGGTRREVDVLIEDTVNGYPVKIAIECRDHERPQEIQWIDALIGKYSALHVNQVIAVSSSGFSHSAYEKAAASGILALTVTEALTDDWRNSLKAMLVKFIGFEVELRSFVLHYADGVEAPPDSDGAADWLICNEDGSEPRRVREQIVALYEKHAESAAHAYINEHQLIDAARPKDAEFEFAIPFDAVGAYLIPPNGLPLKIARITINASGTTRHIDATTHRRIAFGRKFVTVASLTDSLFGTHTVTLAEVAHDSAPVLRGSYQQGGGPGLGWLDKKRKQQRAED